MKIQQYLNQDYESWSSNKKLRVLAEVLAVYKSEYTAKTLYCLIEKNPESALYQIQQFFIVINTIIKALEHDKNNLSDAKKELLSTCLIQINTFKTDLSRSIERLMINNQNIIKSCKSVIDIKYNE